MFFFVDIENYAMVLNGYYSNVDPTFSARPMKCSISLNFDEGEEIVSRGWAIVLCKREKAHRRGTLRLSYSARNFWALSIGS